MTHPLKSATPSSFDRDIAWEKEQVAIALKQVSEGHVVDAEQVLEWFASDAETPPPHHRANHP